MSEEEKPAEPDYYTVSNKDLVDKLLLYKSRGVQERIGNTVEASHKRLLDKVDEFFLKPAEEGGLGKAANATNEKTPIDYVINHDKINEHGTALLDKLLLNHLEMERKDIPGYVKALKADKNRLRDEIHKYGVTYKDLLLELRGAGGDIQKLLKNTDSKLYQTLARMASAESEEGRHLQYITEQFETRDHDEDNVKEIKELLYGKGVEYKFDHLAMPSHIARSKLMEHMADLGEKESLTNEHYVASAHLFEGGGKLKETMGKLQSQGSPTDSKEAYNLLAKHHLKPYEPVEGGEHEGGHHH